MKKVIITMLAIIMIFTFSGCIGKTPSDQKKIVEAAGIAFEVDAAWIEDVWDSGNSRLYTFNNAPDSPAITIINRERQAENNKENMLIFESRLLNKDNIMIIEYGIDDINGIVGYHAKYKQDIEIDVKGFEEGVYCEDFFTIINNNDVGIVFVAPNATLSEYEKIFSDFLSSMHTVSGEPNPLVD